MIVYELLVIIIKYNKLNYIIIALTRTIFLDGACKNKSRSVEVLSVVSVVCRVTGS